MEYLWTDVVKDSISSMHLKKDMDLRRSYQKGENVSGIRIWRDNVWLIL